ncbi:MAG: methyltransferase [Muribaculum sp.]|nr:methyltransferase [Muribaculaceae bacterium]MCM1081469.1 methyltransferase [Muribaculum sp.]
MGTNKMREQTFRFKQFVVENSLAAMKIGTDGVLLGAWADGQNCNRALDVGTGCGLITLMLAQRYPRMEITAIDIVTDAVKEARSNFSASPWCNRLEAKQADFNTFHESGYDLVVSNPPFFSTTLRSPDKSREAARHGVNLTPADIIVRCARELLSPMGRLCMITPADMRNDLEFCIALEGMHVSQRVDVITKTGAPSRRILWEIRRGGGTTSATTLLINSDQYRELTAPFYLH